MARKKRGEYSVIAGINITPFTDVVLVLLIIFMIATPLLMLEGIRINLPTVRDQPSPSENEDVFVGITISADGTIYIDGRQRALDEIKPIFQQILKLDPDSIFAIGAHENTPYESVVRVIDIARSAGVTQYVLVK